MAIRVDDYLDQAVDTAGRLQGNLNFASIVLDNWAGMRLIYGGEWTAGCGSDCRNCALFRLVGEDGPDIPPDRFRTTLKPASATALATFPGKQKYLNCKTFDQYLGAFAAYFVQHCRTAESIEQEMELLRGFRIIAMDGASDVGAVERTARPPWSGGSWRRWTPSAGHWSAVRQPEPGCWAEKRIKQAAQCDTRCRQGND